MSSYIATYPEEATMIVGIGTLLRRGALLGFLGVLTLAPAATLHAESTFPRASGGGFIVGGGLGGGRATFGFSVGLDPLGNPQGHLEYRDRASGMDFTSTEITAVEQPD